MTRTHMIFCEGQVCMSKPRNQRAIVKKKTIICPKCYAKELGLNETRKEFSLNFYEPQAKIHTEYLRIL